MHYPKKYYKGDYLSNHISMYDYFPEGKYYLLRKDAVETFLTNSLGNSL